MNIVFFGSSKFAVSSLKALVGSGHNISCVVTQPDRRTGRHLYLRPSAVKEIAAEAELKIYQPENVNAPDSVRFLKAKNPDLFVVIAYGQILSSDILNIPKVFSINVHASLLPKYRGAAPINWAIIRGDKITGVSIIKMTEKMDAGPLITEKEIEICDDDTSIILEEKLSRLAKGLLLETIRVIEKNDYKLILQDESKVTFAPKLKKENGKINWKNSAGDIYNLIRGCVGWPGAFTYYKGRMLKIYKATLSQFASLPVCQLPGEITRVSKDGIVVATAEGNLIIKELQIEGKRIMSAGEFIAGHKIIVGDKLNATTLAP
jgi:methionyl-tRNA formyltransferase